MCLMSMQTPNAIQAVHALQSFFGLTQVVLPLIPDGISSYFWQAYVVFNRFQRLVEFRGFHLGLGRVR